MASQRVGGLYVAVGVDTKPALDGAAALNKAFEGVASSISSLDKKTNLTNLAAQLNVLAGQAERARAALGQPATGSASGAAASAASTARAETNVVAKEAARRTQITRDSMNLQQAMEKQGLQQWGQMQAAATREMQNEFKKRELAAKRSADAQVREAQRAAKEQVKVGSVLTSGAQELFVGLGAARSGNYFYGLAAGTRYAKNFTAELAGASTGMKVLAGGAAAGAATVALLGAAFAGAAWKIASFGQQGAAELQMFQIQLRGLLGDANRARTEFDFLLNLGKESIIPTTALIDADRQLLAFGVTADDTRRGLVQFASDWGTATGKTAEQIYYLNLALGQVSAIGKANTVDMRQLANVGVSTSEIYAIIGENIGKSSKEVAAGLSEGLITSDLLFAALLQYGLQFQATAEAAKNTTNGLLQNIKDNFTIGLSQAFLPVNDQVAGVLQGFLGLVKSIDFTQLGASFANALANIKRAFAGIDMTSMLKNTITAMVTAIDWIGASIAKVILAIRMVVSAIHEIANAFWLVVNEFNLGLIDMAEKTVNVLDFFGVMSDEWGAASRAKLAEWRAYSQAEADAAAAGVIAASEDIINNWESMTAVKRLYVEISPLQSAVNSGQVPKQALDPMTPEVQGILARAAAREAMANALAGLNLNGLGGKTGGISGGGSKADPVLDAAKAWIEDAKQKLSGMKAALKSLTDAIAVPFTAAVQAGFNAVAAKFGGQVQQVTSAMQEAFTDAVANADANAVITQYTDLRKNLYAVYNTLIELSSSKKASRNARDERNRIVKELEGWTADLVRLAAANQAIQARLATLEEEYQKRQEDLKARRDVLTAQYEAQKRKISKQYDDYYSATSATEGKFVKGAITLANEALKRASDAYNAAKARLDELLAARSAFLEQIKSSITSYMDLLGSVSTEIERYTRLDEFGSFALTKTNATDLAAFKKGLQDRLDALITWRQQVQQLMSSGLDAGLLQQIVQAGPEQSGSLVTALAGASSADIQAINAIQQQVASEITAMQTTASAQWFDAGIAAQQAFTAPLQAAYEAAQAHATALQEQKDLALGILEAWYIEQGELIDAEEAAALDSYNTQKKALELEIKANNAEAKKIADQIQQRFDKLPRQAWNSGVNAMQSLADGMEEKREAVLTTARSIANAAAEAIRNALQINSPSKVTQALGEGIGEGLALGMQVISPVVEAEAISLGAVAIPQFNMPAPAEAKAPTFVIDFRDDRLADLIDIRIEDWDSANSVYVGTGRRLG